MMKKEQKRKRLREKIIKLNATMGDAPTPNGNTKKRLLIAPVPANMNVGVD